MKTQQQNQKRPEIEGDLRSREYINKMISEIGLLTFYDQGAEPRFETIERGEPWFSHNDSGYVETGRLPDQTWMVEYGVRNDVSDWKISVMNFSTKPDRDMIACAMMIEDITNWLKRHGWNSLHFNCLECGETHHWLDTTGSFAEKWENFQKYCCNCSANQKAV